MAISDRYQRLLRRRAPQEERLNKKYEESYEKTTGENTRYILGALKPVDIKYTKKLQEQGDRVESQLSTRLKFDYPLLAFRRQGSVSNLTHIRYFSDVDILVIIDKYHALEFPQQPITPYNGNPIEDLNQLRKSCLRELKIAFPAASLNDSGSTALTITGGSLTSEVDVVPSNWLNTNAYKQTGQEHDRGIEVFDRDKMERCGNYPFLFNYRINQSDIERLGLTRMLIRLLKTIKADYEEENSEVSFSSFDICSVVYRLPHDYIAKQLNSPLDIIRNLLLWMGFLIGNESIKSSLKVVDDSRLIFDESNKVNGLKVLYDELISIYKLVLQEQHGTVLLTEAHLH